MFQPAVRVCLQDHIHVVVVPRKGFSEGLYEPASSGMSLSGFADGDSDPQGVVRGRSRSFPPPRCGCRSNHHSADHKYR